MAQPTQQYPPRTFSPHSNAGSPPPDFPGGPPAAKRARLSPNGQSPYASPNMANLSLPNQVFSAPYAGYQANGIPSRATSSGQPLENLQQARNRYPPYNISPTYNNLNNPGPQPPSAHSPVHNTPNSAAPNAMPPPGRPDNARLDNKPTDLNELGDVLYGGDIDLKEEEAALFRPKDNHEQNLTFEDQLRQASGMQFPFQRDNFYSQNMPGDRNSFYGAGTFNQRPQKVKTAEELAEEEEKRALRKHAEIKQYHLNNPFLNGGSLERRLRKEVENNHVLLPERQGVDLMRPTGTNLPLQRIAVHGPDNHDTFKLVKGEPLLGLKNSLVEIFSLVSLAAEERLRIFVEDAAIFANGRRTGAGGLPPPDLTDLAARKLEGEAAVLPTPENSAVSPGANPLKRSYSEANQLPTPPSTQTVKPSPNPVTSTLQKLAQRDRLAEEARLAKRKQRAERAALEPRDRTGSTDSSMPGTPGGDLVAPEPTPKKSALKKDAKKAPSDAQAFGATNKTLNMALGFGGVGGKKLSWMKQSTEPTNPYLASKKTEAASKGAKAGTSAGKDGAGGENGKNGVPERKWGEFREDGREGKGIQMRDLVYVLERDGKEKKALQRAYMRLNAKSVVRRGTQ